MPRTSLFFALAFLTLAHAFVPAPLLPASRTTTPAAKFFNSQRPSLVSLKDWQPTPSEKKLEKRLEESEKLLSKIKAEKGESSPSKVVLASAVGIYGALLFLFGVSVGEEDVPQPKRGAAPAAYSQKAAPKKKNDDGPALVPLLGILLAGYFITKDGDVEEATTATTTTATPPATPPAAPPAAPPSATAPAAPEKSKAEKIKERAEELAVESIVASATAAVTATSKTTTTDGGKSPIVDATKPIADKVAEAVAKLEQKNKELRALLASKAPSPEDRKKIALAAGASALVGAAAFGAFTQRARILLLLATIQSKLILPSLAAVGPAFASVGSAVSAAGSAVGAAVEPAVSAIGSTVGPAYASVAGVVAPAVASVGTAVSSATATVGPALSATGAGLASAGSSVGAASVAAYTAISSFVVKMALLLADLVTVLYGLVKFTAWPAVQAFASASLAGAKATLFSLNAFMELTALPALSTALSATAAALAPIGSAIAAYWAKGLAVLASLLSAVWAQLQVWVPIGLAKADLYAGIAVEGVGKGVGVAASAVSAASTLAWAEFNRVVVPFVVAAAQQVAAATVAALSAAQAFAVGTAWPAVSAAVSAAVAYVSVAFAQLASIVSAWLAKGGAAAGAGLAKGGAAAGAGLAKGGAAAGVGLAKSAAAVGGGLAKVSALVQALSVQAFASVWSALLALKAKIDLFVAIVSSFRVRLLWVG